MSHGGLSRYDTLLRVEGMELRLEDASALLGLGRRQIFRLLGRLRADGPEAQVSWKCDRPSNHRFNAESNDRVLELVREHYHDFRPTLATENLLERHAIAISNETLRK